ncbi:MAG: hypothetical protein OEM67_07650 [Thermoleophilia bacterium]|nr:hypothetical protein [Thermoleophilia bacterium]MDH3725707.1 hypothetical protein [Thermoleophilia bacterium]
MSGGRSRLWIALALTLAVGALLVAAVGGRESDSARILIAREPLTPGLAVREVLLDGRAEWLAVRGAGALEGLLRESDETDGLTLSAPVGPGEPISRAALGGVGTLPPLSADERLISLPLSSAGAVAGALTVGTRVDVASTVAEGPLGAAALIVGDSEVVGIETGAGPLGQGAGGVILKLARSEALAVSEALGAGRDLRLIVRPSAVGP